MPPVGPNGEPLPYAPGGPGIADKPGSIPAVAAGSPGAGPTSSPMSTPQPNAGLAQAARTSIQIARKQLEQSLPGLGSDTPEGKAVLAALTTLAKAFGQTEDKDSELIPAEIMQLLSSLGTRSPAQAAMAQKPPLPEMSGVPA